MWRRALVSGSLGVLIGALLLSGTAAAQRRGWRIATTRGTAGEVSGIACVAGRACQVVGLLDPAAGTDAPRPLPVLRAISCPRLACVAVGSRDGTALGAWRRSDGRWRLMPMHPWLSGPYDGVLSSVSCTTAGFCLAVGTVDAHTRVQCAPNTAGLTVCETNVPVLERWDGRRWRPQSAVPVPVVAQVALPDASEQTFSSLDAVSCASVTACAAVGQVTTWTGIVGPDFADTWNGRRWRMTILPTPPGTNPRLTSISCVSERRCVAVGTVTVAGAAEPYAAEEHRGVWSDVSPLVVGPARLTSVSCLRGGTCVAVGDRGRRVARRPLVERWSDGGWQPVRVPVPPRSRQRGGSELVSVSCASNRRADRGAASCAAVGQFDRLTRNGWNVGWFVESVGPALPVLTRP